jgi:hypothetical protein
MNALPIQLSKEELDKIVHLAGINSDIKAIARFLNLNANDLQAEYLNENSPLRQAMDTGIINAEYSISKKQFDDAKLGDKESIREWKKDANAAKWERYKQKLLFDQEVSSYETLRAAVENGIVNELPEKLQKYYEVIDFIRALYNRLNSRTYIINQVRLKWKEVSYSVANKLYYESLNFFNLDNAVKKEAWANVYAERLDLISNLALENKDLDIAGKYAVEAAKMRGVGREQAPQVPAEILDRRPILYSIKITDLGGTPISRNKLGALIDGLDVSEKDKTRLKRDGVIEGIPFELFENAQE